MLVGCRVLGGSFGGLELYVPDRHTQTFALLGLFCNLNKLATSMNIAAFRIRLGGLIMEP